MKKIITLLLVLVMSITLAACANSNNEPVEEKGEETTELGTIGLAISTQNNPFFVTLKEGAESKAKELGVELVVADAGDDAAKQASDIEDLIAKGVKVLIVNAVDSDAVSTSVQDALDKGIKVIAVDRAVNGATVDCFIASDNALGAELAAQFLVDTVGEGATVIELQGQLGTSAATDRGTGFHNVADSKLKVVASQTANFDRAEGMSVMEDLLQANPDVQCVFAHNDEMALGAIEAINGKNIVVAGFDATDDALVAIEAGTMAATVAQQPALMGSTAVSKAVDFMKGIAVDASVPVEVKLVTK